MHASVTLDTEQRRCSHLFLLLVAPSLSLYIQQKKQTMQTSHYVKKFFLSVLFNLMLVLAPYVAHGSIELLASHYILQIQLIIHKHKGYCKQLSFLFYM